MVPEPEIVDAARLGDHERVRELLRQDSARVEVIGAHDKTALHLAAEHDHREVAELLLEAGADLEAETSWGMTPLQWAATVGRNRVGELLLAHGAVVNVYAAAGLGRLDDLRSFWVGERALRAGAAQARYEQTEDGVWRKRPPAADVGAVASRGVVRRRKNGHVVVVAFLLERGADIDFRGFFGAPGLHWAAINGHAETIEFLLARGADPTLRDTEFDSNALGWAEEGGHGEVLALLRRHLPA